MCREGRKGNCRWGGGELQEVLRKSVVLSGGLRDWLVCRIAAGADDGQAGIWHSTYALLYHSVPPWLFEPGKMRSICGKASWICSFAA